MASMTPNEFKLFQKIIYDHAGIDLAQAKHVMVSSRLTKRLNCHQLDNFSQYFEYAMSASGGQEFQMIVDILTTNETYFFREPKHFDFLQNKILKRWRDDYFRLWSAASSSGEEAYSIAMLLAEILGVKKWSILGTDLSTKVLEKARKGVYMMDRIELLDRNLMEKYCLKGVRSQDGAFRIAEKYTF